ncbi:hypothetical protein PMKS-003036 [Pichia membranifaciens]|uniref:Uncharacterized protein n=1 Tax=Pichia membranifaciens TaxID=4926 RepID=A0A1Q2YJ38_9ASCO|nr:hypothetical protein PMKS-003036 [Pichia membranifaciens]
MKFAKVFQQVLAEEQIPEDVPLRLGDGDVGDPPAFASEDLAARKDADHGPAFEPELQVRDCAAEAKGVGCWR